MNQYQEQILKTDCMGRCVKCFRRVESSSGDCPYCNSVGASMNQPNSATRVMRGPKDAHPSSLHYHIHYETYLCDSGKPELHCQPVSRAEATEFKRREGK